MAIKTAEELRNHILQTLDDLQQGKNNMDVHKVAVIAKSGETIMSTIKMQLAYANMIGEEPDIEFLQSCHKKQPDKTVAVEGKEYKMITSK